MPTLPIGVVLSSFAVERMLRAQPERTALAAGMIATGVAVAVLSIPQTKREEWRALHRFQEDRWEAIGNQLAASWSRDTRLATAPIGAMGYFSGLPILDLLGLTHTAFRDVEPDMTVRMKGHHRYDAEWVLDQAPEAIVLGNGVLAPESNTLVVSRWEQTLFQHPRFAREYSPMVMPIEGSYPLYFFLSNAAFPPPGAKSVDLGSTRSEGSAAGSAPPR